MENFRFTTQENQFTGECLPCTAATFKTIVNSGDVNRKITASSGKISFIPEVDLPEDSSNVRAVVTAWPMDDTPNYMVFALSQGAASVDDRVRYYASTNAMPGVWAKVQLQKNEADVRTKQPVDEAAFAEALRKAGYTLDSSAASA